MLILQKKFTILIVKFTEMHDSFLAYLSLHIPKPSIMHKNVPFQHIYSVQLAIIAVIRDRHSKAYSEHFQKSKMRCFVKKDNA